MRVFFIGSIPLTDNEASRDSMEAHVVATLQSMGIQSAYFPVCHGRLSCRINRLLEYAMTDRRWLRSTPMERSLLEAVRNFKPELILLLLGNYTTPSTIRKIREITDAPVACWCQDHMGTMGRQYLIGSKFDYIFAKDQVMVDLFRRYTNLTEVHYLPEACNPAIHRPVTPTNNDKARFGCEVTTAATLYYYRAGIMEALSGFDLRIWGPIPRFYDGPLRTFATGKSVYTRDKAACFNAAKIVVNSLFPMEFGGLNARAFEVAGCGGFQLITHSDAVARHFEPGKEIETFRDLNELCEKVRYYLDHEDERRAIAEAGRLRAHREHTYEQRLSRLLDVVKSSKRTGATASR
jgi:spore maturation protein CgeB